MLFWADGPRKQHLSRELPSEGKAPSLSGSGTLQEKETASTKHWEWDWLDILRNSKEATEDGAQ